MKNCLLTFAVLFAVVTATSPIMAQDVASSTPVVASTALELASGKVEELTKKAEDFNKQVPEALPIGAGVIVSFLIELIGRKFPTKNPKGFILGLAYLLNVISVLFATFAKSFVKASKLLDSVVPQNKKES